MNVDWDGVARKADNSIGAQLATAEKLYREGRIDEFIIAYGFRNAKGAGIIHQWWRRDGHGIGALGLAALVKAQMTKGFLDDPGVEDADEVEPDE